MPPPVTTVASSGVWIYMEALEKPKASDLSRELVSLRVAILLWPGGATFTAYAQSSEGGGRKVLEPKKEIQL